MKRRANLQHKAASRTLLPFVVSTAPPPELNESDFKGHHKLAADICHTAMFTLSDWLSKAMYQGEAH
jgi:hypothetical protein